MVGQVRKNAGDGLTWVGALWQQIEGLIDYHVSFVKWDLELLSQQPHHHHHLPYLGYIMISRETVAIPTLGEAVSEAAQCLDGWSSPSL